MESLICVEFVAMRGNNYRGRNYGFSFTVNHLASGPRPALLSSKTAKPTCEADMNESKRADWRELCAAAADEHDATKLTCLVNQIIEAFDEDLAPRESNEIVFHPRAE